ncbi:putative membrane protein [Metabacillus crassostreae]|uniref:PH domain-containing protein n=1 Tax=Metabacillus crassostreae TaxID=929098 RepID=UPI001957E5ED|nr:PH domain-containing protein [Metabacillus crassostreae]MBM7605144.1 putative membrane protein [Metabacillus crassostreae]
MKHEKRRYHPALIAVELLSFFKNSVGFYLFLFILKASSTSTWVIWGRYILIIASVFTIISIVLKWSTIRYEITNDTIIIYEGIFIKKQRHIAFSRIHNHTSNTNFVHRWFKLTSLKLDTGTTGDHSAIEFPVITIEERKRILSKLDGKQDSEQDEKEKRMNPLTGRTVHFQSTKKDLIRASFTSLSFLAIFPLLSAIYFNLAEYFQIEDTAENALDYLFIHWWILIILFIFALAISIVIGFFKTSMKYGNYVISDNQEQIFIEKGIGNFTSFSIQKNRVQAVIVEQTLLKRILGLASIKLISTSSFEGDDQETSSLYPFMPKHKAYEILHKMLPNYYIEEHMERFPTKVLWLKLLRPYYLTIFTIIGLYFFKKEWLWISAIIFTLSILLRVLDYLFTSYIRHGNTVQIRKGGLTNSTFVTHRERIQQITVKHSWLQRQFGVATLLFSNKAKPLYESELYGVPREEASTFFNWYHKKSLDNNQTP